MSMQHARGTQAIQPDFDLPEFMERHGLQVRQVTRRENGHVHYGLEVCPFNPDHQFSSIGQSPGRPPYFTCLGDASCKQKGWKELRALLESDLRARLNGSANGTPQQPKTEPVSESKAESQEKAQYQASAAAGSTFTNPTWGQPLNERDYERLAACGITSELAEKAQLQRVNSQEGGELVGRDGSGDYAGIVFPNIAIGETRPREYRLRRDHPELEYKEDGKPKEKGKYLSPPRAANYCYFAPGASAEWLTDPAIPIVIVEGEKKTLALSVCVPAFVVGLPGVWNFRDKSGKATGPDGSRRSVLDLNVDIRRISWEGREVTILFDSNVRDNQLVQLARRELTAKLQQRGATVSWFSWPKDTPQGVNGIDDLIGLWGSERVSNAIAKNVSAADDFADANVDELARAILADEYFAQDAGGRLYVYRDGVYKPHGEKTISQLVKNFMTEWNLAAKWNTRRGTEVAEYIRIDAPELWQTPPADVINVQNGLLDVRTRELKPHSPEFLSAVQLPVTFDPEARCPAWDKFVADTFPEDCEALAWEVIAWLMTPSNSIQKAVLLLGEGSNGKSTYLRGCEAFIGRQNTAALSLHKLEQDKFATARLVGKLANICPDLPTAHLSSTSAFKALTGGDVMLAERKFCDSFEFVPFCKLIFSANRPPHSDDTTHGFFRRWLVVPFLRCFEDGAKDTRPREEMDASLADPAELSGVLNKALQALAQIRRSEFTESETARQTWQEFKATTDPLAVWLEQNTVQLPTAMVAKSELFGAFNRHLADAGRPSMTPTAFGLALRRACPNITEAQRTWRGREKTWVYNGIGFAAEVKNDG
jgi:putative DNA primase/helicase